MKICTKCKIEKELKDFPLSSTCSDGHRGECKACTSLYLAILRAKNKKKQKEYMKEYYIKNKDKLLSRSLKHQSENKESKAKYDNLYKIRRKKVDINYRLAINLRSRINKVVKGLVKGGSAVRDLGCSVEFLKNHLESNFVEGMTWDNYGLFGWHVDHVKPLSKFNLEDREEFLEACHYTNLQPLWAKDNLSKSNKY